MRIHVTRSVSMASGLILSVAAALAQAQSPAPTGALAPHGGGSSAMPASDAAQIQQELAKLREQTRQLEQRVQANAPAQQSGAMKTAPRRSGGAMAQSGMRMARMDMMDDDMAMPMNNMASPMPGGSGGGMGMMDMMRSGMSDDDMMGMGAMGGMTSPAAMATPSALPGFPGQSHLYHIGSTGFFLDHPRHIALTIQQQQMLAQHKQQSLLRQGELRRQIETAEEKLWQLTGADQPQIASIDKQVREVERLRAERRLAFIRDVGEAAKVLTEQQRKQLTGMAPAQAAEPAPMSMPDSNPAKPGGMNHM